MPEDLALENPAAENLVLPTRFQERMRGLLGAEYTAFERALLGPRTNGLRVNTLKLEPSALAAIVGWTLEGVPWCNAGFYVSHHDRVGQHLLHALGAYYVQEPSAMAVAEALQAQPGERVLDLCAAPGGKSTQIAAHMGNTGLLVCNDINANRASALQDNLERLGCVGAITNEDPRRLAAHWGAYFDRVLLDAPCGGEGMFRKNPEAATAWREASVQACAATQRELIAAAVALLRPGGRLVYSTCTFAPEENEAVIAWVLHNHPELELLQFSGAGVGFDAGRPDWASDLTGGDPRLQNMARLWPHHLRGEGHCFAVMQKTSGENHAPPPEQASLTSATQKIWRDFSSEHGTPGLPAQIAVFRQELQCLHPETPTMRGLRALRLGPSVAHIRNAKRLEPHHAASRLDGPHKTSVDLALDDPRLAQFLRGETLNSTSQHNGWVLLRATLPNGNPLGLGWGKQVGYTIKNHVPKHLRAR